MRLPIAKAAPTAITTATNTPEGCVASRVASSPLAPNLSSRCPVNPHQPTVDGIVPGASVSAAMPNALDAALLTCGRRPRLTLRIRNHRRLVSLRPMTHTAELQGEWR